MAKKKWPQLLHNRVLISLEKPESKSAGGIIIPSDAQEQQNRGKVVAVGPGKKDEPMVGKVGQMACYGEHCGEPFEWEGKDYLIMRESDILYYK